MSEQILDEKREEALRRFRILSPLIAEDLSSCEERQIRAQILIKEGISERTLRRWRSSYQKGGFDALIPKSRKDIGTCKAISTEALELACRLREEVPRRSAQRLTEMLKHEGFEVSRSTLDRHLRNAGKSVKELSKGKSQGRRFVREGRNTLWQSDIKYGPYIPDPKNPSKNIRTYLLVIIDDATRFVVHAEFYDNQRLPILEDAIRKAILRCGLPSAIYVDNGKIFVSGWLRLACAKLGIRHMNTKAYSPESKGKVERFNRTVEEFFAEIRLENPQTIAQLNTLFRVWLQEGYNHKVHSSLSSKTPAQAFAENDARVRFPSPEALRDAFLWEKEATVDKSGCIKLLSNLYDVGIKFIKKKVLLKYDPFHLETIEIWHQGELQKTVEIAKFGEFNGNTHKDMEEIKKADESKLLRMFADQSKKRLKQLNGAFSLSKEAEANV